MDSATRPIANGVDGEHRGSASENDISNSSEEDELIVDVVGESENLALTLGHSAEDLPRMCACADDTANSSDSQSQSVSPPISAGRVTDSPRKRRPISAHQRCVLWESFQRESYPNGEQHKLLAAHLKLDEKRIKSWFQNHRTHLRRSGSLHRSSSPVAMVTSHNDSPTAPTAKPDPAIRSTPREHTPLAANEAPEVVIGTTSHGVTSTTCSSTYKQMTQESVSPNHPFYFLTDSRVDCCTRNAKSLKRKTPSIKTPPLKSNRQEISTSSEPCLRRRRMTPRQRREQRKLTLHLVAQSGPVANPDQPLDLSTKSSCDRLASPETHTPSSTVYSERSRSAFMPIIGRNANDPCFYPMPMSMGLLPYVGINYPHFPSSLGHQWPVRGHLRK